MFWICKGVFDYGLSCKVGLWSHQVDESIFQYLSLYFLSFCRFFLSFFSLLFDHDGGRRSRAVPRILWWAVARLNLRSHQFHSQWQQCRWVESTDQILFHFALSRLISTFALFFTFRFNLCSLLFFRGVDLRGESTHETLLSESSALRIPLFL